MTDDQTNPDLALTFTPITNLAPAWQSLAVKQLAAFAEIWRERAAQLKGSKDLTDFEARLSREWAIETGVIENLYSLSRGATEILIQHGIRRDLIHEYDTNEPPDFVTNLISDQEEALESIFEFVKGSRELSTSYIKELHVLFTRRQPTIKAKDAHGNTFNATLLRGEYKRLPNNPSRRDGSVHYYTPPIHVAAEMDNIVRWHKDHIEAGVPPEIEAAWLHHRFTQIHPFQDGNGRVARAIASAVFIRAGLFPIVINRDIKPSYLDALELADAGDLSGLINLFAQMQLRSIEKALSLSEDVLGTGDPIQNIIDVVNQKLKDRDLWQSMPLSGFYVLFGQLRSLTKTRLEDVSERIADKDGHVMDAPSPYRTLPNQSGTVRLALPSSTGNPIFIQCSFETDIHDSIALAHVVSTIVLEDAKGKKQYELSNSPFTFAYNEEPADVEKRFQKWLNDVIINGLDQWRRHL